MMLFDTHNHFDDPIFDHDRLLLAQQAVNAGVQKMVITGITSDTFERILSVQQQLNHNFYSKDNDKNTNQDNHQHNKQHNRQNNGFTSYSALGLHPFFIHQHSENDLQILEHYLKTQNRIDQKITAQNSTTQNIITPQIIAPKIIALGEIGLDTFSKEMKEPDTFAKQQRFFIAQLDLAVKYQLPVLLHIRKAHGDSLRILKNHAYDAHQLAGIAHSFSGGEQEAKAFVKLGFKLGITGQVCNPNAKKLRKSIKSVVNEFGLGCLVIETDCPDMTPLPCQTQQDLSQSAFSQSTPSQQNLSRESNDSKNFHCNISHNVPENLVYILHSLSELLQIDRLTLTEQLWENSLEGLALK